MVVIGDIHGCIKSLKKLLTIIDGETEIYSVGDLIDRGPDPRGVVSVCMERGIRPVMGNHEHLLLDYLEGCPVYGSGTFLVNGGRSTLESYGNDIPSAHLDFLRSLPLYIENEHFFLSHAGVHPSRTLEEACEIGERKANNILWNRRELKDIGKLQVVGHTPVPSPRIFSSNGRMYGINIDTGCAYPSPGKLTAISFPDRVIRQMGCED